MEQGEGRALVVYDTVFLGARVIAEQVAEAIGESMPVELFHIADAPVFIPEDCTLLVLGVPESAEGHDLDHWTPDAVYSWLEDMPGSPCSPMIGVFETHHHAQRGRWVSSAERLLRLLAFRGCMWRAAPQSFRIPEGEDPSEETLEHARGWARALVILSEAARLV